MVSGDCGDKPQRRRKVVKQFRASGNPVQIVPYAALLLQNESGWSDDDDDRPKPRT